MSHAVICSWCGKTLTEGSEPATHTCCSTCQTTVLEEIEESTLSRENIRESLTKPGAHAEY